MFLFPVSTKPFKDFEGSSKIKLLDKYKEFAGTPHEHQPFDRPTELQPRKEPQWGPIYNLSPIELEVLHEYIDENTAKGFIQHSKFPAMAPIFSVKKKDGPLHLVVDYQGLNKVTIRNRYALALISSILEYINGAKRFTKIDL